MNQEPLAISSVPIQHWEETYGPERAFERGTIFPALDKPFFAAETGGGGKPAVPSFGSIGGGQPLSQERALRKIQEISFVLDDLRLYLDTHPRDVNGLELLKAASGKRAELLREFALHFYPLTFDCMAGVYETNPASECYCWEKGPLPWEGACA